MKLRIFQNVRYRTYKEIAMVQGRGETVNANYKVVEYQAQIQSPGTGCY